VIGFGETTEANDFDADGNGDAPWTLLELAKRNGMKVGAVSTATITHATPAASLRHIGRPRDEVDHSA
jgi:alkaline phosphatase